MKTTMKKNGRRYWMQGLAAAGLVVTLATETVRADHPRRRVSVHIGRGWVAPVYETRARTIVIPPVFETRAREVWHEPVYETRRVLVDVPDEYVERRIPRFTTSGRLDGFDTVRELVRSERQEWQDQRIVVREGYYETVYERVLVQPATTRVVYDRVLVRPGRIRPTGLSATSHHRIRPHRLPSVGFPGHRINRGGFDFSLELGR